MRFAIGGALNAVGRALVAHDRHLRGLGRCGQFVDGIAVLAIEVGDKAGKISVPRNGGGGRDQTAAFSFLKLFGMARFIGYS
jgi:hypothetical protein